jgi:hypothetical protein
MFADKPQCNGKACLSYREARAVITDAKRFNHLRHSKRIPKRAYFCKECKQWHLTSMSYYKEFDRG